MDNGNSPSIPFFVSALMGGVLAGTLVTLWLQRRKPTSLRPIQREILLEEVYL